MVSIQAEPPQGRDESEQLRTSGKFSIPLISPPQGLGIEVAPTLNGWIDDFGSQFVDDLGNSVVFDV